MSSDYDILPLTMSHLIITTQLGGTQVQLTFGRRNHWLTPMGAFSEDDRWLVYDLRAEEGAMGANGVIEKVSVASGETVAVYQVADQGPQGPGCGTASYGPAGRVVFLRGLKNCDARRPYGVSRRTAVMVDETQPGRVINLDARDVTAPFTPGALRGGTHAHEWSGDGQWIGFTYNDAVVTAPARGDGRTRDLRTVGVSADLRPVRVDRDAEGDNNDGAWFSVLVARVTPEPAPGSDEISRAYENAWVGRRGFQRADGTWQRAQAFLGNVLAADGREVAEVYIAEIPERIDVPGDGPLEGTATELPAPPRGTVQRRLTRTAEWKHPGVALEPRHWVACDGEGRFIAFLAHDDAGVVQIFLVRPQGGQAWQLPRNPWPVASTINWAPAGDRIAYVADGSVFAARVDSEGRLVENIRLTAKSGEPIYYPTWSHDGRTIAYNRQIPDDDGGHRQIFLLRLPL
jgi:hypothetical protein